MIGELAALGAAICWTFSAVLYREALTDAKPLQANTVRCLGTSIILILCLALAGKARVIADLPLNTLAFTCLSGLVGLGLGDTLYLLSLKIIGVARAVPITCTYPLFSLVWAVLLAGEDIKPPVVIGAIAIVFGIWLISRNEKVEEAKMPRNVLVKGIFVALSTAIVWSISITLMNLAVKGDPGLENAFAINTLRVAAISAFLLIFSPIAHEGFGFLKMKRKTIFMLLAGGIIALGLGWFFLALSFSYIPESRAVPISSTTPFFSTLLGILFLHEGATAKVALGSAMIVFGIFLIFAV
ncbi:MAG: DMT family transporter [Candidatus Bathyarchaeia archaeon]